MADITSPMTPEQLENNYEFKVVKRALMKEFPWIKDVVFRDDELNTYNLIFLNFVVDPVEMSQPFGWSMMPWVQRAYESGLRYKGNYVSMLFDVEHDEGKRALSDHMESTMIQVHESPALPEDLRLPKGRSFAIGSFIINPEGKDW
jgi:hypothetical protein